MWQYCCRQVNLEALSGSKLELEMSSKRNHVMEDHLLIDGFNFAHALGGQKGKGAARDMQAILYEIENFVSRNCGKAVVVFDGTRYKGLLTSSRLVDVVFSKPGESADDVMERFMNQIEPKERLCWILVSDDRRVRDMAVGSGLRIQRPGQFIDFIDNSKIQDNESRSNAARKPFNNPFCDKL